MGGNAGWCGPMRQNGSACERIAAATLAPNIAIAGQPRTLGMTTRTDRHHDRCKSPSRYCGWVVERCFAWLSRNRRMAKEYERLLQTSETVLEVAVIRLLIRQLAS